MINPCHSVITHQRTGVLPSQIHGSHCAAFTSKDTLKYRNFPCVFQPVISFERLSFLLQTQNPVHYRPSIMDQPLPSLPLPDGLQILTESEHVQGSTTRQRPVIVRPRDRFLPLTATKGVYIRRMSGLTDPPAAPSHAPLPPVSGHDQWNEFPAGPEGATPDNNETWGNEAENHPTADPARDENASHSSTGSRKKQENKAAGEEPPAPQGWDEAAADPAPPAPDPPQSDGAKKEGGGNFWETNDAFTAEQDAKLKEMKAENKTWKDIAAALGMEHNQISKLKTRYKEINNGAGDDKKANKNGESKRDGGGSKSSDKGEAKKEDGDSKNGSKKGHGSDKAGKKKANKVKIDTEKLIPEDDVSIDVHFHGVGLVGRV